MPWKRVPGGTRTPNLLLRSQMLYPVELQTQLTVPGQRETGGQRDSKPMEPFRHYARFLTFLAGKMRVNRQQSQIGYCRNRATLRSLFVRICPNCPRARTRDSCDEN